jgi:RNA-binding protein
MLNSKDRAKLRSIAMNLSPVTHIGKNGVDDSVVVEIDQYLEAHELMKIVVLKNADFKAKDVAEELASDTNSEVVQVLGQKITLYRLSNKDKIKHIL